MNISDFDKLIEQGAQFPKRESDTDWQMVSAYYDLIFHTMFQTGIMGKEHLRHLVETSSDPEKAKAIVEKLIGPFQAEDFKYNTRKVV